MKNNIIKSINSSFLFLLCFFALISLQTTCQKAEPRVLLTNDTTFLSFWYFPINSYWIYEDSVNGELDTFTVTWNDIQLEDDNYYNYTLEFHVIHLINKGIKTFCIGRPFVVNKEDFIYFLQHNSTGSSAYRFFISTDTTIKKLNNDKLCFIGTLDSLNIKNKIYEKVVQMSNIPQGYNDSIKFEYFVKGIGVVKRVYQNNRVWELKEYYIAP